MGIDLHDFVFENKKLSGVIISNDENTSNRQAIECDKVVLCLGSNIAPVVRKTLNVNIPIVGIKGYSFDLVAKNNPRDLPAYNGIFILGQLNEETDEVFTVTTQVEGSWRITSYGDIAGQ